MGTALLAGLARELTATSDPAVAAARAADGLRALPGAARVVVWRADRAARCFVGQPDGDGPLLRANDIAALPAPDGAHVVEVNRFGTALGAIEVHGDVDMDAVAAAAHLLALHLGGVRLAEDFALEVAERARAVEEAWQFASMVIDSLPVGLYVVDRAYRIRIWNRKRETGTQGLSRGEAVGRTIFDVLTRQPAAALRQAFDAVFETGQESETEVEVDTAEGMRVYRQTRLPMRLDGGAVTHVITIGEDVTEWRRIQQRILQSEKLASIGQLAAGVMHEINNPLATIGGAAVGIAYRAEAAPPLDAAGIREHAALIEREVARCTRIVNGLLDFSRPASQVRGEADINELVEATLELVRHHERFRRVRLERHLAAGLPTLRVNGEQIIQVILAILLNALDALPEGGRLAVSTGRDPARPGEVWIEIQDWGPGMAPGLTSRIFDPFFTTKAPGRGTGLGLSIAYGLVEAHRGRIMVESEPGRGTLFRITLPGEAAPA